MTIVRVVSYNLLRYGMDPAKAGEKQRYHRIAEVIRQVDPDVLVVQELASPRALQQLAGDVAMECRVRIPRSFRSDIVCDPGRHGFGLGVMWRQGIEAIPGTVRTYTNDVYFHGMVAVYLDVGGRTVQAASTHGFPFGGPQLVTEANRTVAILTRPDNRPAGFVGSDSNGVSGDRICRDDNRWDWHAPDPYAGAPWHDALVYQCNWCFDEESGQRSHWADRAAGEALWSGGLYETGAVLGTQTEPTAGYWPEGDPYGDRDIDHIRVTSDLARSVQRSWVHRNEVTDSTSDHRPKVAELDLRHLVPSASPVLASSRKTFDRSRRSSRGKPRRHWNHGGSPRTGRRAS